MTTAPAPQIAFPVNLAPTGKELAIPPAPVTPANAQLENFATATKPAEARTRLRCSQLLIGDTLTQAKAEAERDFADLYSSTPKFMAYGSGELKDVNALIDRLLNEIKPVAMPELRTSMQNLNDNMRKIKGKWDVSDPKTREKYEHYKGGVLRFFGRAKSMFEMFIEDATSIQTQLNKIADELDGRTDELLRNVGRYDQIYVENEAEIAKLIYRIGVMELISELAANKAAAVPVGDAAAGDRGAEERARLTEFASNMEIKAQEYKGRLMIAWSTSPQVRMMRTIDTGLAIKVNSLIDVTIPTMKATLAQWSMLAKAIETNRIGQAVADTNNEWLTAYASAFGTGVSELAAAIENPTLLPETIAAIAAGIDQAATGVLQAQENGEQRRAEMDAAIHEALPVIADAEKKVSEATINRLVSLATKPLEIATSVATEGAK